MSLLTPLGFLGLASIAVLIIIYIIKPNYQQKVISSTYVWKLSLKYKRKRLPINKFRNILLFICQLLILAACAFILAQPFIAAQSEEQRSEKIVIIDASASMLSMRTDDKSRFDHAVSQVEELAENFLSDGGVITVIVAGSEPTMLLTPRLKADSLPALKAELGKISCSYGAGSIDGAMELAEGVLLDNPEAEVMFYTGTQYIDKNGITVVDVSEAGEWNAAILDCKAEINDNMYSFSVDVACYGRDTYIMLYCDVFGVGFGDDKRTVSMSAYVKCDGDKTQTVEFVSNDEDGMGSIPSYEYAYIHIDENDSFSQDNGFYLYGGVREEIRIQYCSTKNNAFFEAVLMQLREFYKKNAVDITVKEIMDGKPELEGFDFYIFEHTMPETIPEDGVVLLVNPDRMPEQVDIEIEFDDPVTGEFSLDLGLQHPLNAYMHPERINVTKYLRVLADGGFEHIMYCGGDPVFLVKNEENFKVGLLSFSLNNATFAIKNDFPTMMLNMFKYFMPSTFTGHVFEVDDEIALNARGAALTVDGPGVTEEYTQFPSKLSVSKPGIYTVKQTLISEKEKVENFYVKIPAAQSNIKRNEDSLANLYIVPKEQVIDEDLLIYFAAALVALLFLEWLLQSREQF
ncbi:MAG: BatA and WFA domain-containing protein [Clostridia bacterium]|nr:BatA and WFA domain-containing protein [Clostridia bacterium]